MSQILKKSKEEVKKGSRVNPSLYRPGFRLSIKKKLNGAGYAFIVGAYTLGVVCLTLHFSKPKGKTFAYKDESVSKSDFHAFARKLATEMKAEMKNEVRQIKTGASTEMRKMREGVLKEVGDMNLKYLEVIQQAKKAKEQGVAGRENPLPERFPASVQGHSVALNYNYVNAKVLRKKHRLELKRLREAHKKEEERFVNELDLSKEEDQQRLRSFHDRQKLEITALEAEQLEKRRKFQKEKYIVVDSL